MIKRKEINELYEKCNISKSNLDLLVINPQLRKIATSIIEEGLKFSTYIERFVVELNHKFQSQNTNFDTFMRLYKEPDMKEMTFQLANDDTKLRKEAEDLVSDFLDKKLEMYQPLLPFLVEFENKTKEYLTEIL